jgi:hypothetical protein
MQPTSRQSCLGTTSLRYGQYRLDYMRREARWGGGGGEQGPHQGLTGPLSEVRPVSRTTCAGTALVLEEQGPLSRSLTGSTLSGVVKP